MIYGERCWNTSHLSLAHPSTTEIKQTTKWQIGQFFPVENSTTGDIFRNKCKGNGSEAMTEIMDFMPMNRKICNSLPVIFIHD